MVMTEFRQCNEVMTIIMNELEVMKYVHKFWAKGKQIEPSQANPSK